MSAKQPHNTHNMDSGPDPQIDIHAFLSNINSADSFKKDLMYQLLFDKNYPERDKIIRTLSEKSDRSLIQSKVKTLFGLMFTNVPNAETMIEERVKESMAQFTESRT